MRRFKNKVNIEKNVFAVARRRAQDTEGLELSDRDLDRLTMTSMASLEVGSPPTSIARQILDSNAHRKQVKDAKGLVGLLNSQVSVVGDLVENLSSEAFASLRDIQREAYAADSTLSEEEIKVYGQYTTVHFNAFVRGKDFQIDREHGDWDSDPKTGLPFMEENQAVVVPKTGLLLPIKEVEIVPIVDAFLVEQETDSGDTREPLVWSDPRLVFIPGKVFRYAVIHKDQDSTSRVYPQTYAEIALMIDLGVPRLLNQLRVCPGGHSTLEIRELSYLNDSGETVELDSLELSLESDILLMFEPVRTRYLKIRVRQQGTVERTEVRTGDVVVSEVNKLLAGAGVSQLFDSKVETITGRVFDFSIESIEAHLVSFEPLGVFRSKPIKVNSPAGMSIDRSIEAVRVSTDLRNYGLDFVHPEGEVLQEAYVGVKLRDSSKNVLVDDLIPMLDSTPWQREFLASSGRYSKVKFFPDIRHPLRRYRILTVTDSLLSSSATIETDEESGFQVGDTVRFICPAGHGLNSVEGVISEVVSPTEFKIPWTLTNGDWTIDEDSNPRAYVYLDSDNEAPFEVYEEGELLTLGTDYEFTLDRGVTWLQEFPFDGSNYAYYQEPSNWDFGIKLLNKRENKLRWVVYKPLKNQWLGNSKKIMLKNGRIVFSPSLRKSRGSLTTVLINRADSTNPYLSSITLFYSLKVREHVS